MGKFVKRLLVILLGVMIGVLFSLIDNTVEIVDNLKDQSNQWIENISDY